MITSIVALVNFNSPTAPINDLTLDSSGTYLERPVAVYAGDGPFSN